jgi:hypothetical protein
MIIIIHRNPMDIKDNMKTIQEKGSKDIGNMLMHKLIG